MKKVEPIQSYIKFDKIAPRQRIELRTNDTIKDEIFASLKFVSEVPEAGKDLIKTLGFTKQIDKSYNLFSAFIKQSRTFFESAETLHFRASSLNYYYSFLNITKAYIALHEPNYVEQQITHGLQYFFEDIEFSKQKLILNNSSRNVFTKFYKLLTGSIIPRNVTVDLMELISYCTDIAHEYEKLKYGTHKNACAKLIVVMNNGNSHILLAIVRHKVFLNVEKSLTNFHNYFNEVNIGDIDVSNSLNISDAEKEHYKFFESVTTYPVYSEENINKKHIRADLMNALKGVYLSNPYDENFDFLMPAPLTLEQPVPFNEILAIYSTMFYLASLVRYYPWYLEKILGSKDGWLIERFTKCSSITFLRHMISMINNVDYVFATR